MGLKKGTLQRPASASEPIIRLTGTAEQYLVEDDVEVIAGFPRVPPDWRDIFDEMFGECVEVVHTKRKRSDGRDIVHNVPPVRKET